MRKLIVYILMIVFISVLVSGASQVFQPDSVNGTDTRIYEDAATTNYGAAANDYFGTQNGANTVWRTLYNFNFTCESIPSDYRLTNSTLSLYREINSGTTKINMYKMNCTWDESTVTWNNCGNGGCDGCYNDTIDYVVAPDTISTNDPAILILNYTYFQDMCDRNEDYGFIILGNETAGNGNAYYGPRSSDHADPNERPELNLSWAITLDNCTDEWDTKSLIMKMMNVSNDANLTGIMEVLIEYTNGDITGNYSTVVNGQNQTFCIEPESAEVISDILVAYEVAGTTYSYDTTLTLTSTVQTINLYASTGTTIVTLIVYDENGDAVKDAYISIKLFDVGTNTYKTTEIVKTDSDGIAYGNIILNTEYYAFDISYDDDIVFTSDEAKISASTKTFRINLGTVSEAIITKMSKLDIKLSANKDLKKFEVNWSNVNNTINNISLEMYHTNVTANFLINYSSSVSNTGTMNFTLPFPYNKSTGFFVANVYGISVDDGNKYFIKMETIDLREEYDVFDEEALMMSFLYVGTMVCVGLIMGVEVGFILLIFAMIMMWMLGFYALGVEALISVVILAIVIMIKGRRGKYGT